MDYHSETRETSDRQNGNLNGCVSHYTTTMILTPARRVPKKTGRTEYKVNGGPKRKKSRQKGDFTAISEPTPKLSDGNISDEAETTNGHICGTRVKEPESVVDFSTWLPSPGTSEDSVSNVEKLEQTKQSTTISPKIDEWTVLISQASLEKRKYPDDYDKPIDIKGACPLFTDTVLSHQKDILNDNADKHQLNGTARDRKDLATEKSVLEEFAKSSLFSEWTSELLPQALNLKISKPPEKSLQILFLAVGIPPFVLVTYEPDSSGKREESARNYASEIARVLTRSLLNYCHCEFILLACALPRDKFSVERLSDEVEERRKQTSKIYYRRQRLSRSEFLKLKEAVTIVSRVSPVGQHLSDTQSGSGSDKTSQTLVILDQAWYNLVLYFVKIMDESLGKTKEDSKWFDFDTRNCPPNVISKAKAAAKEAGRRLGLKVQTTEDKDLQCLTLRVEKPP